MRTESKTTSMLKSIDMYKRIPMDLLESSSASSPISIATIFLMCLLILLETYSFFSTNITSTILLGVNPPQSTSPATSRQQQIQLSLNISLMDLPCDRVYVSLYDQLGWNKVDVNTNIEKHHITAGDSAAIYAGRNMKQPDVLHDHDGEGNNKHGELEGEGGLYENGVHALLLDEVGLAGEFKKEDFVFVDFYAPWCIWCQRLEPTWEAFAEKVDLHEKDSFGKTAVVKVDCEEHAKMCGAQAIGAFPTLRMFYKGEKMGGDFKGDRTVDALTRFVKQSYATMGFGENGPTGNKKTDAKEAKEWDADSTNYKATRIEKTWNADDHPGCQINGNIWVNRLPGRLQIEAKSQFQNVNPKMANVSHIVHHLSFGMTLNKRSKDKLDRIPAGYGTVVPMNGNVYKTDALHTAHHHHLNVVPSQHMNPTDVSLGDRILGSMLAARFTNAVKNFRPFNFRDPTFSYNQISYQSQLAEFKEDEVPAVTFAYEISPLTVQVGKESMPTYEFIVKLMALVGGTYTIIGLTERSIRSIKKKGR